MPVNHGRSEKKDGPDLYQNFDKTHECFINVYEEISGSLLLKKFLMENFIFWAVWSLVESLIVSRNLKPSVN